MMFDNSWVNDAGHYSSSTTALVEYYILIFHPYKIFITLSYSRAIKLVNVSAWPSVSASYSKHEWENTVIKVA